MGRYVGGVNFSYKRLQKKKPGRYSPGMAQAAIRHWHELIKKRPLGMNGIMVDEDFYARKWQLYGLACQRQMDAVMRRAA